MFTTLFFGIISALVAVVYGQAPIESGHVGEMFEILPPRPSACNYQNLTSQYVAVVHPDVFFGILSGEGICGHAVMITACTVTRGIVITTAAQVIGVFDENEVASHSVHDIGLSPILFEEYRSMQVNVTAVAWSIF